MKNNLLLSAKERFLTKETLVFGGFAFLMLVYNVLFPAPLGDDFWFQAQSGTSQLEFWSFRYNYWSSRNIIEAALLFFSANSLIIIRLVMTAVMALAAALIFKMFAGKTKYAPIFTCSLLVIFMAFDADILDKYVSIFTGAGYLATALNYAGPAVLGLLSLYPLKKLYDGEKVGWYEWLCYLPCLVFAANQEQMSFVLLAVYLLFAVYFLVKKKLHPMVVVQLALAAGSIVYILTCPGNKVRLSQEIGTWYPRFAYLSLFQKVDIGITCALEYFFKTTPLLILFTFLLAAVVFKKYEQTLYRVISAIPLGVTLLFGPLSPILGSFFKNLPEAFSNAEYIYGWLNLTGTPALISPFKFIIGFVCVCAILVSIYLAFGHSFKSLFMLTLFVSGIATKMVMGFSPTVYISGERTAFFYLFAVLIISVSLFSELDSLYSNKFMRWLAGGVTATGILAFITICAPLFGI